MLALCSMLLPSYYAQNNYGGIIGSSLLLKVGLLLFINDVEVIIIKLECISCFKLKLQCKLYS